ncbi:ashwin [Girardinichthys multiradiatus]|uniref:ashwin n=1 Tax=Girardinichthys multiradiatus TaxID=208333 RepID=UPI001FACA1A1|nr:ashwin [Girardinichthys multiradiatus]
MAATTGQTKKSVSASDADLLLHPELLSQDFMQLILRQRNVGTRGCEDRDRLTELYLRHIIPLPQRNLPNSRWGRKMEKSRGRQTAAGHSSSNDQHRNRPLIVFDGKSSQSGPLKVKKPESPTGPAGATDRLKPPPSANLSNPIRKLSGTSSSSSSHRSSDTTNLKRDADASGALKSPEVRKKIQHITWP